MMTTRFTPLNPQHVFKNERYRELIISMALFWICSQQSLLSWGIQAFKISALKPIISPIVYHSAFKQFCGGENITDCKDKVLRLSKLCVGSILDHAVEECQSLDELDANLHNKLRLIESVEALRDIKATVPFIPVKLSALIPPSVLDAIAAQKMHAKTVAEDDGALITLVDEERRLLSQGLARVEKLCETAKDRQVSLLIDAEQLSRQSAIEVVYRLLAKKFNVPSLQQKHPVVYNTYQCYLRRTSSTIQTELAYAQQAGYVLGIKLVRGAYMQSERQNQASSDALWATKLETDACFDSILIDLLSALSQPSCSSSLHLIIATHNRLSVENAVKFMEANKLKSTDPRIHFAQILGMSDHLTYALAYAGYNVSKLVPYGSFDLLLPWLLRRLEENKVLVC